MERVYIQWTIVNWITVFLMAVLGFMLLGAIAQAAHNFTGKYAGSSGDGVAAS